MQSIRYNDPVGFDEETLNKIAELGEKFEEEKKLKIQEEAKISDKNLQYVMETLLNDVKQCETALYKKNIIIALKNVKKDRQNYKSKIDKLISDLTFIGQISCSYAKIDEKNNKIHINDKYNNVYYNLEKVIVRDIVSQESNDPNLALLAMEKWIYILKKIYKYNYFGAAVIVSALDSVSIEKTNLEKKLSYCAVATLSHFKELFSRHAILNTIQIKHFKCFDDVIPILTSLMSVLDLENIQKEEKESLINLYKEMITINHIEAKKNALVVNDKLSYVLAFNINEELKLMNSSNAVKIAEQINKKKININIDKFVENMEFYDENDLFYVYKYQLDKVNTKLGFASVGKFDNEILQIKRKLQLDEAKKKNIPINEINYEEILITKEMVIDEFQKKPKTASMGEYDFENLMLKVQIELLLKQVKLNYRNKLHHLHTLIDKNKSIIYDKLLKKYRKLEKILAKLVKFEYSVSSMNKVAIENDLEKKKSTRNLKFKIENDKAEIRSKASSRKLNISNIEGSDVKQEVITVNLTNSNKTSNSLISVDLSNTISITDQSGNNINSTEISNYISCFEVKNSTPNCIIEDSPNKIEINEYDTVKSTKSTKSKKSNIPTLELLYLKMKTEEEEIANKKSKETQVSIEVKEKEIFTKKKRIKRSSLDLVNEKIEALNKKKKEKRASSESANVNLNTQQKPISQVAVHFTRSSSLMEMNSPRQPVSMKRSTSEPANIATNDNDAIKTVKKQIRKFNHGFFAKKRNSGSVSSEYEIESINIFDDTRVEGKGDVVEQKKRNFTIS